MISYLKTFKYVNNRENIKIHTHKQRACTPEKQKQLKNANMFTFEKNFYLKKSFMYTFKNINH